MKHSIKTAITLSLLIVPAALLIGCNNGTGTGPNSSGDGHDHAQDSAHDATNNAGRNDNSASHEQSHGESEQRSVHLTVDQLKQLSIKISAAGSGSAAEVIEAPATVAFDGDRVSRVGPRLRAKVIEVKRDLGETVARGDVLAVLDSVELGKAKAAYIVADTRYRSQRSEYARDRELAADQIVSDRHLASSRADFEQARAERRAAQSELRLYGVSESEISRINTDDDPRLSRYQLVAPQAGTVAKRDLVAGQTVDANETPIHIVDTRKVWLMIDAYEQALPQLTTGRSVRLAVRPFPDRTFEGVVDWVSPTLDVKARTVQVRADIANPDGLLRAGMFGTARIQTESMRRFALVPVDALQTVEERQGVFVPGDRTGVFVFTPVETGVEQGGRVEITSGLNPGDPVVAEGAFDLAAALTAAGRSAEHSH